MAVRVATGGKADWATAIGGPYTNIAEVRKWTLKIGNDSKQYASSSTAGGKRRIAGPEDFDGTLDIYIDEGARVDLLGIKAGMTGFLKLYEDAGAGNFYIAPAYIEDFSVEVDIEGGNIIGGVVTFARDGALQYAA